MMRQKPLIVLVPLLCTLAFLASCAGRSYLIVDYTLPPSDQVLQGQTVKMVIKDLRSDRKIFSPAAAQEFKGFKNLYSLAWKRADGQRVIVGEMNLETLFRKVFTKRLERMGVLVATNEQSQAPVFEIALEKFSVDLSGRKWIADVTYIASLSEDSHLIAREKVTGSAERLRIIGRKGADTVLSEIFTDIINKVDILKLFQQAKLI